MIHFIHVGKCAGETIIRELISHSIEIREYHCFNANNDLINTLSDDKGDNIYIISVRDPIDRFISAFNFDKFEKIIQNKTNNPQWNSIYKTFDSANHLVESLISKNPSLNRLANFAVHESKLHIHMGLAWYVNINTIKQFPIDRTHIIRTEYLKDDIDKVIMKVAKLPREKLPLAHTKNSSSFLDKIGIDNPLFLSELSHNILATLLHEDYCILHYLFEKKLIDKTYHNRCFLTSSK